MMHWRRVLFMMLMIVFCSVATSQATMDKREAFFETKVRSLLATYCYEYHGPDKQKAGLRLTDVHGNVVKDVLA